MRNKTARSQPQLNVASLYWATQALLQQLKRWRGSILALRKWHDTRTTKREHHDKSESAQQQQLADDEEYCWAQIGVEERHTLLLEQWSAGVLNHAEHKRYVTAQVLPPGCAAPVSSA